MTKHERLGFVALVGFAAAGAAALIFKILQSGRGEDGPIRVKGGSVFVENDDFDWQRDEEENDPEYFLRQRSRYLVKVWAHGPHNPLPGEPHVSQGRRVIIKMEENGRVDTVVFRANGAVRLIDKDGRVSIDPANKKRLRNPSPNARISRIEVRDKTLQPHLRYERDFVAGTEKGHIEVTLQ